MKTRKQWIAMLLMLAMLFTALPIAASAQGVNKVALKWMEKDSNASYNLADKGKTVQLVLRITYWRDNNSMEYEHYMRVDAVVGQDQVYDIPESGPFKGSDGKEYNDWAANSVEIMPSIDDTPCYCTSQNTDGNTRVGYVTQQMNIGTKGVVDPGAIVLEDDWKDLTVHFTTILSERDPNGNYIETMNPFQNDKKRAIVEEKILFPRGGGRFNFFNPENKFWDNEGSFYWAMMGCRMEMYNQYTGKSRQFTLRAEWAGDRKTELEERYNLDVKGDDVKGWTVTLTSNIQKDVKETTRDLDFKTIYEDDPNLYEGETKVKTPGVKGKETVTTTRYYLKKLDGTEKEIDTKETATTTQEPVNEVILRGTKKRPNTPSEPSVTYETVTFEANGGAWANGETKREQRVPVGRSITIESAPTREGYKFLYWKGSEYHPGESYIVPDGGHTFVAQWEKDEKKPEEKPSVDSKIKTPRGSALTPEEIAKILAGSKKVVPAIPRAGVGR